MVRGGMTTSGLLAAVSMLAGGGMGGLFREPTMKTCSRCGEKFNHKGAYCKFCHEKRVAEGKVRT